METFKAKVVRAAALLLFSTSTALAADDKLPDVLTALGDAKAQAEGRALRVQKCAPLKGSRALEDLNSKFEDARSPYNGRIDAWIFVLKNRGSVQIEDAIEAEKLGASLQKVGEFTSAADQTLRKVGCGTQKVVLKEFVTAAIILVPPAAEAIAKLWAYFGSKQKERDEVIKTLEQKKISPWGNINVYYAFDWATETFLAQEDVTDEVLKNGSVLAYVNKWAVKRNPGAVLIGEKQAPDGLSGSYLLYTGKIEAIKQFADSKL